ncbi:hypothetical protein IJT17_01455 [bacterium]|nr:hypothetical protein [bacterium]
MDGIMEHLTAFYLIIYFILGLFFAGKGIKDKLVGACFISFIMTILTFYFWWLSCIIIMLIGFAVAGGIDNPSAKKAVLIVFTIIALITAATGISYKNQAKAKQLEEQRQQQQIQQEIQRQQEEARKQQSKQQPKLSDMVKVLQTDKAHKDSSKQAQEGKEQQVQSSQDQQLQEGQDQEAEKEQAQAQPDEQQAEQTPQRD